MPPGRPHDTRDCLRPHKMAPRCSEDGTRHPQEAPKTAPAAQEREREAPRGPRQPPKNPQRPQNQPQEREHRRGRLLAIVGPWRPVLGSWAVRKSVRDQKPALGKLSRPQGAHASKNLSAGCLGPPPPAPSRRSDEALLGLSWGPAQPYWAPLGPSCSFSRPSWAVLGSRGAVLGPFRGPLLGLLQ